MATTAVALTTLAKDTASAALVAAGTTPTNATDGWVVSGLSRGADELLILFNAPGGGDTITVAAGDRPPAQEKDLGALTITLGASESKLVFLRTARFLKRDGTIVITCTSTSTKCYALATPRGH